VARDPNGDTAFWQKVQKEELPHCGQCDPYTRQIERDDGRVERCPRCHPLQDALLPQHWRCPACRALIPRVDRGLPCGMHRTVTGFRAAYDEALSGQDQLPLVNPTTESGAKDARAQLADRLPAVEPAAGPPTPPPPAEEPAEDEYPF